jgi:hypothetical protein
METKLELRKQLRKLEVLRKRRIIRSWLYKLNNKVTQQDRIAIAYRYHCGESINSIAGDYDLSPHTIIGYIEEENKYKDISKRLRILL